MTRVHAYAHVAHRPVHLTRETGRKEHYEGDDVEVTVDVTLSPGLVPPPPPVLRNTAISGEARFMLAATRSISAAGVIVLSAIRTA